MRQQLQGEGVLSLHWSKCIFSPSTQLLHFTAFSSTVSWWWLAMGTGLDRFLWSVLLLLPVFGQSEALPESWLPGEYSDTISDAQRFLSDYNSTAEEVFFHSVSASWNYNTNITDHNSKLQVRHLQSRAHKTTRWPTFALMLMFHCPLYITLVSTSILSPEMQSFLGNSALLDLEITTIHLSPALHAQFPPNAANSACALLENKWDLNACGVNVFKI